MDNKPDIIIFDYLKQCKIIARTVFKKYKLSKESSILQLDDLISSGVIGLMDAIEKYDPTRENKFKTYAEFRIRGAILDEIRKVGTWNKYKSETDKLIKYVTRLLELRFKRKPMAKEIAKELGVSLDSFYKMNNTIAPTRFINKERFLLTDKKRMLSYINKRYCFEDELINREHKAILKRHIALIKKRDRVILKMYLYKGYMAKDIAVIFNVSESRISRLLNLAIKDLKKSITSEFKSKQDYKESIV